MLIRLSLRYLLTIVRINDCILLRHCLKWLLRCRLSLSIRLLRIIVWIKSNLRILLLIRIYRLIHLCSRLILNLLSISYLLLTIRILSLINISIQWWSLARNLLCLDILRTLILICRLLNILLLIINLRILWNLYTRWILLYWLVLYQLCILLLNWILLSLNLRIELTRRSLVNLRT